MYSLFGIKRDLKRVILCGYLWNMNFDLCEELEELTSCNENDSLLTKYFFFAYKCLLTLVRLQPPRSTIFFL